MKRFFSHCTFRKISTFGVFLACLYRLDAHVTLIYPSGGERFMSGQVIEISWVETVPHNTLNWDLLYTPGGEDDWVSIAQDLPPNTTTYLWTIPEGTTTTGRIRIIQDNEGADYGSISGFFEIALEARAEIVFPGEMESFHSGQEVTIRWQIEGDHMAENWDLLFRQDEESDWDTLQTDLPIETREYLWEVPHSNTERGQIGLVQDGPVSDYVAISPFFVISTLLRTFESALETVSIFPNPATDQLKFSFPRKNQGTLNIYDTSGQLVRLILVQNSETILFRENLANGLYYYLFSIDGKSEVSGKIIFK